MCETMLVCTEVGLAAASYLGLKCGTMLVCTALRLAATIRKSKSMRSGFPPKMTRYKAEKLWRLRVERL